jgi:membrane complex biogenesis BtpA family protein
MKSKRLKVFELNKPIIGMIHVDPLPGTPNYRKSVKKIISRAVSQAIIYKDSGIHAVSIENMHDAPYLNRQVGHEISTLMSIIAYEIKKITNIPVGIQILAGANKEALAAAHSSEVDFIRAEGFVFAHVADEGVIESDAGELLRYRKQIGAENVKVFTDIKKKHSAHSITDDIDVGETAKAAEFFLSDGIVITGTSTGLEADLNEVKSVKTSVNLPVIIGSGVSEKNIGKYFNLADAFIVGSYFKLGGKWKNDVDPNRVKTFLKTYRKLLK